jgi:hypothetical protein
MAKISWFWSEVTCCVANCSKPGFHPQMSHIISTSLAPLSPQTPISACNPQPPSKSGDSSSSPCCEKTHKHFFYSVVLPPVWSPTSSAATTPPPPSMPSAHLTTRTSQLPRSPRHPKQAQNPLLTTALLTLTLPAASISKPAPQSRPGSLPGHVPPDAVALAGWRRQLDGEPAHGVHAAVQPRASGAEPHQPADVLELRVAYHGCGVRGCWGLLFGCFGGSHMAWVEGMQRSIGWEVWCDSGGSWRGQEKHSGVAAGTAWA